MKYRKSAFKYVHKPLLWQQNTLIYRWFVKEILMLMHTPSDIDLCDGLCTHNQHSISWHSRWSIGNQRSSTCTSRCYGNKTPLFIVGLSKKSLFGCILLLISIFVTACGCTTNVPCHSTLDGVSEISIQVRAQAVAMATKHCDISLVCERKSLFGCILLLISIFVTACACTTIITCHCTVDGVSEIRVQVRAQAVAIATKHPEL